MPLLRKVILALTLTVTVIASVIDFPGADPVVAQAVSQRPPIATALPALTPHQPSPVRQPVRKFEPKAADLFVSRSWQAPPAPPPKVDPPKAPALPFNYLGKVLEEGSVLVFLGHGARTHLTRSGDVLAEYKVEEITTTGMTLIYLPLNEKQRLTFGSAN